MLHYNQQNLLHNKIDTCASKIPNKCLNTKLLPKLLPFNKAYTLPVLLELRVEE